MDEYEGVRLNAAYALIQVNPTDVQAIQILRDSLKMAAVMFGVAFILISQIWPKFYLAFIQKINKLFNLLEIQLKSSYRVLQREAAEILLHIEATHKEALTFYCII